MSFRNVILINKMNYRVQDIERNAIFEFDRFVTLCEVHFAHRFEKHVG